MISISTKSLLPVLLLLKHYGPSERYLDIFSSSRNAADIQTHQAEEVSSSAGHTMSASVCVRNARTACISEGNHAGLVLLNLLTFMDTVDIPVLAFDETGSVPRGLEQLSGLAKEADYIQAVLSLVPWGVIKNNKDEERSYTDRRIQNAIYESMSIDEKQAAYTNMSFMLRRHYPDKAEAYEYTQAQLSTCKLLFPQVSYHLDRAIASGLKMCDYSAVAAIRAAR